MQFVKQLFLNTIFQPATAGKALIDLRFSIRDGWQLLALASILNALALFATHQAFPPDEVLPMLDRLTPFSMVAMVFVIMGTASFVLYLSGRSLKGAASFAEILTMVAWLQIMRFAVQMAGFFMLFVVPGLATTAMLLAGLYGVWILAHFMNEAQGFDSFGKSVVSLVLSFLGLTVALSILATFAGLGSGI